MQMKQSDNPVAQRSQAWFVQALEALVEEKGYDTITVTDICKRADLDRRTFYRSFTGKEDLLMEVMARARRTCLDMYAQAAPHTRYTAIRTFFAFFSQRMTFIRGMEAGSAQGVLFRVFEEVSRVVFEEMLGQDPQMDAYLLTYQIGGFWNVLRTWIAGGAKASPEEMADTMVRFMDLHDPLHR